MSSRPVSASSSARLTTSAVPPFHCLKCKTVTEGHNAKGHVTAQGRHRVSAMCKGCGMKKSVFVKKGGAGFLDLFSGLL